MSAALQIVHALCIATTALSPRAGQQLDAEAALAELIDVITREHACANTRKVDLQALSHEAMARLGETPAESHVIQEMHRLVAALGDGHAGIEEFESTLPRVFMPVLLARAEHGVVAFHPDRGGLLDPDRPYVISIDRVPLEQWHVAAKPFVPAGSPQLVDERSLRLLRFIGFMREQLGLPASDVIWFELSDGEGDSMSRRLQTVSRKPVFGEWPRTQSRMLDEGIGYLRIADMTSDSGDLRELQQFVERCMEGDAAGLIIDIRGNSGGSRDALHTLLPCFMPIDGPDAMVVNAAMRRLTPDEVNGVQRVDLLADRGLFPANWSGWSESERQAIDAFVATFQPQWQPADDGGLSDWHYTVVSRSREDGKAPPSFALPVVLLIDNVCFSAADVFAGAFAQLPNVTLVGTPTAGGSARARPHGLRSINATVRLGTMYSFQPTGEPYDGVGVVPDVLARPAPTSFINGDDDPQLDKAIELNRAHDQAGPDAP